MPHSIELDELTALYDEHLIAYAEKAVKLCAASMPNDAPITREAMLALNDALEEARACRDGRLSLMFEKAGWTEREFYWYLDGMHLTHGYYNPPGGIL